MKKIKSLVTLLLTLVMMVSMTSVFAAPAVTAATFTLTSPTDRSDYYKSAELNISSTGGYIKQLILKQLDGAPGSTNPENEAGTVIFNYTGNLGTNFKMTQVTYPELKRLTVGKWLKIYAAGSEGGNATRYIYIRGEVAPTLPKPVLTNVSLSNGGIEFSGTYSYGVVSLEVIYSTGGNSYYDGYINCDGNGNLFGYIEANKLIYGATYTITVKAIGSGIYAGQTPLSNGMSITVQSARLPVPAGGWLKQGTSACKVTAISNAVNAITGKRTLSITTGLASSSTAGSYQGSIYDTDTASISKNNPTRQMNEINNALNNNLPIVVEVRGSIDQHWVTVIGRSGSDYIIVDPANGGEKTVVAKNYFIGSASGYYGVVTFKRV